MLIICHHFCIYLIGSIYDRYILPMYACYYSMFAFCILVFPLILANCIFLLALWKKNAINC